MRPKVIESLTLSLKKLTSVKAIWLGGSDANNEVDPYSDIDLFCLITESSDFIFQEAQKCLENIWELDFISQIQKDGHQVGKIFHLLWTPESHFIEVWCISLDKKIPFLYEHTRMKIKVLYDPDSSIEYIHQTQKESAISTHISEQLDLWKQKWRILSYIYRMNYIEATNYYIRFAFLPLVELLRARYTPDLIGWWRIHISRDFPPHILFRLENLMHMNSIGDIEKNLFLISTWIDEILLAWLDKYLLSSIKNNK